MTNQDSNDLRFHFRDDGYTSPAVQAVLDAEKEEARQQAEAAREQARQAAEAAKADGHGQMVADPSPAANWPDDGFQATSQTGTDKVAGALRVGQAGDVAFARDLLNSGQAPLGGVSKPEGTAAEAHESAAGSRAANPGLGLG